MCVCERETGASCVSVAESIASFLPLWYNPGKLALIWPSYVHEENNRRALSSSSILPLTFFSPSWLHSSSSSTICSLSALLSLCACFLLSPNLCSLSLPYFSFFHLLAFLLICAHLSSSLSFPSFSLRAFCSLLSLNFFYSSIKTYSAINYFLPCSLLSNLHLCFTLTLPMFALVLVSEIFRGN